MLGEVLSLPDELVFNWPELVDITYRRGGIPLRVGGWLLGQSTVAAITLGRTIFLAPGTRLHPELLLHEYRHVQQFAESKTFPLHYIWESLTRGYYANRFEADARQYAERRLSGNIAPGTGEEA